MAEPPLEVGAVIVSVACPFPALAVGAAGAAGALGNAAIDREIELPGLYPVRAVATVTFDEVPGARPVTVIKPVLLNETNPPAELDPDQLK